MLAIGG